jgi:hypothetical protein
MTEPVTVSDLKVLVTGAEEISALFDYDTPWWRGNAKAEWSLQAQVFRPERHSTDDEMALMGHFVSRAPSRSHRPCPLSDDHFGWLFLAQHYGLPTGLLDWSENPLVAAFFAVLQEPVDDGCIWGMWPTGLNHAFGVPLGLIQIRDPKLRESAKSAFTGITPPDETEVLAIDGQEIDPRMLAQMGRFTIHSSRTPLEQGPESADWLRQYTIPKEAKAKIRAQLSAFGVQLPNLFPDLGSLAADLKRRRRWASYGSGR